MTKLLNIDTNAKTIKGQKFGYMTGVLYLAPARLSGHEVCPVRSVGCTAACLNTAGRGIFPKVQEARIRKTKQYFSNRRGFLDQLEADIKGLIRKAGSVGLTPVVRLNGTSDIAWERVRLPDAEGNLTSIIERFPDIQFYDYTKIPKRALAHINGAMPPNYHLTFSLNEANKMDTLKVLRKGGNVAIVFRKTLPELWNGFTVINGDASDLRPTDPQGFASREHEGVVVGLLAKGRAKNDQTGFVQE